MEEQMKVVGKLGDAYKTGKQIGESADEMFGISDRMAGTTQEQLERTHFNENGAVRANIRGVAGIPQAQARKNAFCTSEAFQAHNAGDAERMAVLSHWCQ